MFDVTFNQSPIIIKHSFKTNKIYFSFPYCFQLTQAQVQFASSNSRISPKEWPLKIHVCTWVTTRSRRNYVWPSVTTTTHRFAEWKWKTTRQTICVFKLSSISGLFVFDLRFISDAFFCEWIAMWATRTKMFNNKSCVERRKKRQTNRVVNKIKFICPIGKVENSSLWRDLCKCLY